MAVVKPRSAVRKLSTSSSICKWGTHAMKRNKKLKQQSAAHAGVSCHVMTPSTDRQVINPKRRVMQRQKALF